jgi:hypothetical protein
LVGVESYGTDYYTLSGNIFLFGSSDDVSFDEGSFSNTTISDQDDLELSDGL